MATVKHERLFFALWPTEPQQVALRELATSALSVVTGRKLPFSNLHITLNFIGSVDVNFQPEIIARAETIVAHAFSLNLDKIVYRPRQQMLWLEATVCPEPLQFLVDGLRMQMAALGIEQETRPFLAHLTLMRKVRRCDRAIGERTTSCIWDVNEYVLVRSQTLRTGAEYEIIHRFPLLKPNNTNPIMS